MITASDIISRLRPSKAGPLTREDIAEYLAKYNRNAEPLTPPPDDAFDDLPFNVYRNGNNIYSDFDWSPPEIDGHTYYVDFANGSDSNTGLDPLLPLKGIKPALQAAGNKRVLVRGGVGWLSRGFGNNVLDFSWVGDVVSLEAWGAPVKLLNGNPGNNLTWTSDGSGAYHCTLSSSFAVLYTGGSDTNVSDLPQLLTKRADLATLQAASEGFYITGSTVYAKIPGGTTPGVSSVFVCRSTSMNPFTGKHLYMKGFWWVGFGLGMRTNKNPPQESSRFTAVDCTFAVTDQASDRDAVSLIGTGLAAFKNCSAYYAGKDGFNYHQSTSNPKRCIVLEENCISKYTAYNRAEVRGPYQASTAHDGIVVVSIGADAVYGPTLGGPCIQDQGSGSLICHRWCVGVKIDPTDSPTSAGESSDNWGYGVLGAVNSKTWLDDCNIVDAGSGPIKAIEATGPVYVRGAKGTWSTAPTGSYIYPY